MKDIDDLKVGETFQLGNRRFKLEKGIPEECGKCFFYVNCLECGEMQRYGFIPECEGKFREDSQDVIFIEEEK